ncbi:MAG: hypothetical protein QME79_10265 [Bacillota bacterium]|nr:hypothetical protein [Bacillota bacterium]
MPAVFSFPGLNIEARPAGATGLIAAYLRRLGIVETVNRMVRWTRTIVRALDRLAEAGAAQLLTRVAARAMATFDVKVTTLHADTTSGSELNRLGLLQSRQRDSSAQ